MFLKAHLCFDIVYFLFHSLFIVFACRILGVRYRIVVPTIPITVLVT